MFDEINMVCVVVVKLVIILFRSIFCGHRRAGDIRDSVADIRLAKDIGYSPEYMMERGLREAINWYR